MIYRNYVLNYDHADFIDQDFAEYHLMKFDKCFLNILMLSEFLIFMSSLFHSLMTDGKFLEKNAFNA